MVFRTKIKVRFGDIDHAGILYYPRFFQFFHVAFEDFFEEVAGIPYDRLIHEEHIGFPAVRVESEFQRPVAHGDELEVALEVRRMGNASVTIGYTVYRAGTAEVCARSVQTVVCVEMESLRPTPIPSRCREAFEAISAPAD
jgi:4-hydroxybenzoyl-CoA thioesterase